MLLSLADGVSFCFAFAPGRGYTAPRMRTTFVIYVRHFSHGNTALSNSESDYALLSWSTLSVSARVQVLQYSRHVVWLILLCLWIQDSLLVLLWRQDTVSRM
jgi:hypothetical protein